MAYRPTSFVEPGEANSPKARYERTASGRTPLDRLRPYFETKVLGAEVPSGARLSIRLGRVIYEFSNRQD